MPPWHASWCERPATEWHPFCLKTLGAIDLERGGKMELRLVRYGEWPPEVSWHVTASGRKAGVRVDSNVEQLAEIAALSREAIDLITRTGDTP